MPERLKRLRDRPNIKIDSKLNIRFKGPKFKSLPDKDIDTIITALYLTVPNVFIRIISPSLGIVTSSIAYIIAEFGIQSPAHIDLEVHRS